MVHYKKQKKLVLGWLKFAMAALINPQYVLSAPIFLECRSAPAPYQKKEWRSHITPFEKREWHSLIALLALFFSKFSVKKTCEINEDFFLLLKCQLCTNFCQSNEEIMNLHFDY